MSEIARRFLSLRKELGTHVTLVGVAKAQSADTVREAIRAGLTAVANNYVQEGQTLRAALASENVAWHFIGHIQSRKAKEILDYDCVQSLDRESVAAAMNKGLQRPMDVLVQVNVGEEPQKSGVLPRDLGAFLSGLASYSQLRVRGLMALPPLTDDPEARRPYFKTMRRLFEEYQRPHQLQVLSMGMSDDFRIAAEEGSTMVRVGSLLFGSRP